MTWPPRQLTPAQNWLGSSPQQGAACMQQRQQSHGLTAGAAVPPSASPGLSLSWQFCISTASQQHYRFVFLILAWERSWSLALHDPTHFFSPHFHLPEFRLCAGLGSLVGSNFFPPSTQSLILKYQEIKLLFFFNTTECILLYVFFCSTLFVRFIHVVCVAVVCCCIIFQNVNMRI